ncbi:HAMP domain-containing histidine kinase [Stakelama sp. CBK3Z-3]|uniref:HAMP domain-containing histidine kinase n=1 Tax=Stakelama flava TaxID=2860338 RepID=A0ABS6XMD2_9SPHN|nr:HAMP domain-containing sensor histidine kinase [Stakelama flava]MBW4331364.1 HAMP domain-containing histidine kinase [Stakelama flava]
MDSRRPGWPVGRIATVALLPVVGALAFFAWQRMLYANAVLAALMALWAVAVIAVAVRREIEPVTIDPLLDQRAAEAERQQRRLLAYLDLSPAPLMLLEEGYRLRAVNRAARRLFASQDVVADPDPALIRAIADTAPGASASLRADFGTGPEGYALATADIVAAGEASRIAALVGIEAELRAVEARALRNLLNVLSHEIMNGLTPIASLSQSAAELIDSDADSDRAEARIAIQTVARRAEGLRGFGEAYRRLARLPDPVMQRIDIRVILDDLARLFRNRWPRIELAIDQADIHGEAYADSDQLHPALWALLQNAAEACLDGHQPCVTIRMLRTNRAIEITVGDNGTGIADDVRERIFQPFFTTKPDGSGVGLALARMIALAHLGDVVLLPGGETGSRFQFSFAAAD